MSSRARGRARAGARRAGRRARGRARGGAAGRHRRPPARVGRGRRRGRARGGDVPPRRDRRGAGRGAERRRGRARQPRPLRRAGRQAAAGAGARRRVEAGRESLRLRPRRLPRVSAPRAARPLGPRGQVPAHGPAVRRHASGPTRPCSSPPTCRRCSAPAADAERFLGRARRPRARRHGPRSSWPSTTTASRGTSPTRAPRAARAARAQALRQTVERSPQAFEVRAAQTLLERLTR